MAFANCAFTDPAQAIVVAQIICSNINCNWFQQQYKTSNNQGPDCQNHGQLLPIAAFQNHLQQYSLFSKTQTIQVQFFLPHGDDSDDGLGGGDDGDGDDNLSDGGEGNGKQV